MSRVRLVDGDNDYFMFGGGGHHVNGAIVHPSEQQAAGVGLIAGIVLDDLSVSNRLSDVLFAEEEDRNIDGVIQRRWWRTVRLRRKV